MIIVVIKWLYLTTFPISKVRLYDLSPWVVIVRTSLEEVPTLHTGFKRGAPLVGDLGHLKFWATCNLSYIPLIVVETTVSNETAFNADC